MSDEKKMRALYEALADHVESLSDEQLLAEVRESGQAPEQVALEARNLIQRAVKRFKQRPLLEAQQERERALKRMSEAKYRLPAEPKKKREWLAAMMAQPQAQGMLTAHGREFAEMTDDDVEESILELMHLGVLPPGEKPEE
jgi:hypothetical protein